MAGSLNHIVDDNGNFTFDTIENLRDAHEMAEQCFNLICYLSGGDRRKVANACRALSYPVPKAKMVPTLD